MYGNKNIVSLQMIPTPRVGGRNVIVQADEVEYKQSLLELQHSVVNCNTLQKGDNPHTMLDLRIS